MTNIIRMYPDLKEEFEYLINNCTLINILGIHRRAKINLSNASSYIDLLDSNDFTKILKIAGGVVRFFIQFMSTFGKTEEEFEDSVNFIKENIIINVDKDIDYLVDIFSRIKAEEDLKANE